MNRLSPEDHARLMAAARRRAHELRDEASDAFWHGLGDAAGEAARAARRFAARLARHRQLRQRFGA